MPISPLSLVAIGILVLMAIRNARYHRRVNTYAVDPYHVGRAGWS